MDSQIHFLSIHSADSLVWRAVHLRSCSSPDIQLLTTKTTLNDSSQAGGRTALANLKEWMFILRLWSLFFSSELIRMSKQRWWDLNQSLTYYTLTVMSSRYHLILNRGNIILVMYVISHPVLNCRVEWNLVKLCAHPLKYGWALSSFQVWILANEICFSSLCGYPPLSWSNRVSVLWSHHIASFAVNSSLY